MPSFKTLKFQADSKTTEKADEPKTTEEAGDGDN